MTERSDAPENQAECPTCGTLCRMHRLSNGRSFTPLSESATPNFPDAGLDSVVKLHSYSIQFIYRDEDARNAAFRALKNAAPRNSPPLSDDSRLDISDYPTVSPTPKGNDLDRANAAIGSRVRMLVNGGSWDLRDSPKSFIATCERLVKEADELCHERGQP